MIGAWKIQPGLSYLSTISQSLSLCVCVCVAFGDASKLTNGISLIGVFLCPFCLEKKLVGGGSCES